MSTTAAIGPSRPARVLRSARLPALLELLATVAAVALLLPLFTTVAETGAGRDRRFAAPALRIDGLPDDVLPAACAVRAAQA